MTFACGCRMPWDGADEPRCETHGETRVQAVQAPPPRIRTVNCDATGPLVVKA